jgi:hypothetical protein
MAEVIGDSLCWYTWCGGVSSSRRTAEGRSTGAWKRRSIGANPPPPHFSTTPLGQPQSSALLVVSQLTPSAASWDPAFRLGWLPWRVGGQRGQRRKQARGRVMGPLSYVRTRLWVVAFGPYSAGSGSEKCRTEVRRRHHGWRRRCEKPGWGSCSYLRWRLPRRTVVWKKRPTVGRWILQESAVYFGVESLGDFRNF